jgi:hypothetical protein
VPAAHVVNIQLICCSLSLLQMLQHPSEFKMQLWQRLLQLQEQMFEQQAVALCVAAAALSNQVGQDAPPGVLLIFWLRCIMLFAGVVFHYCRRCW